MNVWYAFLNALGIRMFEMDFMKNALLAVLLLGPLFGLLSTMIVTGKMSFFSDALGHSGFTGIAIGVLCGAVQPIYFAVGLSVLFALLFSFVRSRTSQSADTIIGVFSSTAVALGIFIVTLGGRSFTKFNRYLIGDILSVSPQEIGLLALVLLAVVLLWVFGANRLVLTAVHPQLASSRGVATNALYRRNRHRCDAGNELGRPDGYQLPARAPSGVLAQSGAESAAVSSALRSVRACMRPFGTVRGILAWLLGRCDDRAAAGCLLCRVLCTAEPGCLRKRQNFAGIPCGFRLFCHLYAGKKCDKL